MMSMATGITLLRGIPSAYTFAPRLAGGLFVLFSATLLARLGYLTLGSSLNDFYTMTMANRVLMVGGITEWSLFSVGFFLLADERAISDLRDAKQQASRAGAAEAALSRLSGKLLEAQEQERAQIARELHEDLAQQAAALAVHLHDVLHRLPAGTNEHASLQRICDSTAELARGIQGVAQSLRSATLELLGLTAAAGSLCRDLSTRHHMKIDFGAQGIPEHLPEAAALCLFRVLEEALTNALKHARGPVTVTLRGTLTDIHLAVIDRGIGFDSETRSQSGGLGLIRMRERLNLVGGDLHVESHVGEGTTVRARVPVCSQWVA
jgi:signal transduction histidine kinase